MAEDSAQHRRLSEDGSRDWTGRSGQRIQLDGHPVPKAVARSIERMIDSGALSDGARLPSQRGLSKELGVSRTSVREAISLLESSGRLRTEPGRGTYVRRSGHGTPPIDFERLISDTGYSKLDICRFRHLLEGHAGRLAAMRITDEQIRILERNLNAFRTQTRAMDFVASANTDVEFHHLIVRFSGVRLFLDLHTASHDLVLGAVKIPRAQWNRAWEPVVEHERILEALKRRDPDEARYYMQSHIVRSAERLGILLAADVV